MKNRKRLAVIMATVMYQAYQHPLLAGIIEQAFALNYDVCIFSPFMNYDYNSDYYFGENRIFDLIPYDQFDAVLYAPCSFTTDYMRTTLEEKLDTRCHIPIIGIESNDPRYHNVLMDDCNAFARVTDHLIEQHHVRKIYCLTGFKDNWQAEQRQLGYRKSMERHGLPVPDGYVIYGDFWKTAALELAERLVSQEIEMPEAIVCCCDTVALTLTNRLIELGIRIPEDLLIASYDQGEGAEENIPSVTTYVRPIEDMGMRAVLRAHECITGETAPLVRHDYGYLVPAGSCGCGFDFRQKFEAHQKKLHDIEECRKLFEGTPMAESLNATTTLNELLTLITHFFYLVDGITDFYMCLCDQWDDISKNTDNSAAYDNYTPTMHLRITSTDNNAYVVDEPFPLHDLLPALHHDRPKPRAYYITPLHFNNRCLGYTALSYGDSLRAYDSLYHSWIRNINNALEFMRNRNNFNSLSERLFTSSVRDALTGIFNRKGYTHYAQRIFDKAKENAADKKLLILAADLDCLKQINDTYGHLEGDRAITVTANALNTALSYGEVCARTGGDEFLIIGCGAYTDEILNGYIRYIHDFLTRYNTESGRPYEVGVSLGYYCDYVRADDTLQSIEKIADARMYQNKAERKKMRIS